MNIAHIVRCVHSAARHPRIATLGATEFRSGVGMTYDDQSRSDAYDAGRELAHIGTFRRFEQW
jgi:hypothetical protein